MPSARVFVAPLGALTAAAGTYFFYSPTLYLNDPSFKSWSSLADTCAIFIPSIIVNSISSNSIGEQRSTVSVRQGAWQRSVRWRRRSSNAWMTSPSFKFDGECCPFLWFPFPLSYCPSGYANRSARFISAYHAGLSGSQAAWANRKYHGHRTLPPDIIAEVRHSILE